MKLRFAFALTLAASLAALTGCTADTDEPPAPAIEQKETSETASPKQEGHARTVVETDQSVRPQIKCEICQGRCCGPAGN